MWKAKRAQASISVFFVSSVVKRKGKGICLIFYDFQHSDNIKEPYNLAAVRLSKLKQPIKEIDCLFVFLFSE
jgi:hypothetical protein